MRHSMSEGGRAFPPPKYCSYSIFSWRMSLSSCPSSSSTVLGAMECEPHGHNANRCKTIASTRRPPRSAEQVIFLGIPIYAAAAGAAGLPEPHEILIYFPTCPDTLPGIRRRALRKGPKNERGSETSPFRQNPNSPRSGPSRNALTTPGEIKTTCPLYEQTKCQI